MKEEGDDGEDGEGNDVKKQKENKNKGMKQALERRDVVRLFHY